MPLLTGQTVIIGNFTKSENNGFLEYISNNGSVKMVVNPVNDSYKVFQFGYNSNFEKLFADIADLPEARYGAKNAEELVDYFAENNFFFDVNGGGSQIVLDTIKGITTQAQSPILTRAASWQNVVFASSTPKNDTFELLPDNTTFVCKRETIISASAKIQTNRINNSNNRSIPDLRILRSTDGGLIFEEVPETLGGGYIRNSNNKIEFGSASIPSCNLNYPINTQYRLQIRMLSESATPQEQIINGYFNLLALSNEVDIVPVSPQILNPLPLNLTINSSELFSYNLQIINATSVTLENSPPYATIDTNGILVIQSPIEAIYPSFKVIATNATDTTESTCDLTIQGFVNAKRVQLNGNDQYLRTDDTSSLDFQRSQSNSISFWVEFTAANINPILSKYDFSTEKGYWLIMDLDKRLRWKFSGNGTFFNEVKWNTVFALNTRYHICISWQGNDATDIELFVNGILQTQRTVFSNTLSTSGDPRNGERLEVGYNPDNGQLGDFIIDELCFWKGFKVLTTQAPELYNNGFPLNMDNFTGSQPQNWWRMGEGSTIPIINNEKSTTAARTMIMVNADNNIIDF